MALQLFPVLRAAARHSVTAQQECLSYCCCGGKSGGLQAVAQLANLQLCQILVAFDGLAT